jgi:hypothetical protein
MDVHVRQVYLYALSFIVNLLMVFCNALGPGHVPLNSKKKSQ